MTSYTHDIIVIGAGSAGLTCAIFMQREGFKVLLVDRTDASFGGDCLNYGCVPSKALIHLSKTASDTPHDIQSVLGEVQRRQDVIREHENPAYLRSLGIDVAIGAAHFSGKKEVTIGTSVYSAKKIVIATGSRPREITIPGSEHIPIYTNESIFSIKELPKKFVFIGGGPIAIELGQAFSRLGSSVTIVQSAERILPREDPDVSLLLAGSLQKEGIDILTGASVESVTKGAVVVKHGSGKLQEIPADALFVAVGRIPNTDTLQLDKAGIKTTENNTIVLDDQLRTTNKSVVAIGDAAAREMFTHAAELQAQLVLNNFFSPLKKSYSADGLGWTTFTDPEVSTFGLSAEQLVKKGVSFQELKIELTEDDRAITENATNGFLKLRLSKKGLVLGGVMVGNRSGEIASEILLMMHAGISLKNVMSKPYPYPIGSRVIQTAAREFTAKKLYSKRNKRLLRLLYR